MIRIGVNFGGTALTDYPLSRPLYLRAYADLGEELAKHGATLYVVRDRDTYLGGSTFSRGWRYEDGRFVEVPKRLEVDLIFNKHSHFMPDPSARLLNRQEFDAICNDKLVMYHFFSEFFPGTEQVGSPEEVPGALEKLRTETVIAKPLNGYGGKDITVGTKEEIAATIDSFPFLLQEFMDTSKGIPGVTEGVHDFRIVLIGEVDAEASVILTFIRTPKDGKRVNRAGQNVLTIVPPEKRPEDAMTFVRKIDEKLRGFGRRLYSIDCARDRDGSWKLIELNAPPGQMTREELGREADTYFDAFARFLVEQAQPSK